MVCTVSRALAEEVKPWISPEAELHVVGAGVADELFAIRRAEADYVMFLGRFDIFQKGLDTLLDAMVTLRGAMPSVRLRILGRGRDAARLDAMIESRRLRDVVDVAADPSPGEIRDSLSGALAVAIPSRFEGFGMVAAEAMAAGVPVIASDIPALREVVDPPNGGVLVPEGDAAALAREMERVIAHPSVRLALSATARRSAHRFRWNVVAEEHLAFLQRIADSSES